MVFQLFSFHPRIFVYTCFSTLRAWNKLDNKRKDARRMRGKLVRKCGQRANSGTQRRGFPFFFFQVTIEQITKTLIYLVLIIYRNV